MQPYSHAKLEEVAHSPTPSRPPRDNGFNQKGLDNSGSSMKIDDVHKKPKSATGGFFCFFLNSNTGVLFNIARCCMN